MRFQSASFGLASVIAFYFTFIIHSANYLRVASKIKMRTVWSLAGNIQLCSGLYSHGGSTRVEGTAGGRMEGEKEDYHLTYLSIATFLLGVQALVLNAYVLQYYWCRREGVFPLFYFIISLCNGVLGLDSVLHTGLLLLYLLVEHQTPGGNLLFNYLIFIVYTLTTTARNCKVVYNTMLIGVRAVKYCSPQHVISRNTITAAILLFPILWMLFLAAALNFQFSLPAEVNMEQYIYYPEPNSSHEMKIASLLLLYVLPFSVGISSLGVCLYKQRQKHNPANAHKLKALKLVQSRVGMMEPTYGQSKVTDVALTVLMLACYFPYVVVILLDVAANGNPSGNSHLNCAVFFVTGVILPFANSAVDPILFVVHNSDIRDNLTASFASARNSLLPAKHGVRFAEEAASGERTYEHRPGSASMSLIRSRANSQPDVIEYKDSDEESDSSLESFEYRAHKHRSRRYR